MQVKFLTLAALLLGSAAASTPTFATQCTLKQVTPPQKRICGQNGAAQPAKADILWDVTKPKLTAKLCAAACLLDSKCQSISFTATTHRCRGFHKTPIQMKFKPSSKSSEVYWHRTCWSANCPKPTTTRPSGSTSTSPPLNQLPTTPPATIYQAATPPDYSHCQFDPTAQAASFNLLDPADGVPFLSLNGLARKSTEVLGSFSPYTFVPVSSVTGVFDLVSDGLYLAFDLSGNGMFVEQSSNGGYITQGTSTYITSIFSFSCDGKLQLGIPNIVPFELGSDGGQLFAQPIISQYNPPSSGAPKRDLPDAATRLAIAKAHIRATDPLALIVAPVAALTTAQTGDDPRCPNDLFPLGTVATVKPGARPASSNGCGASDSPVPNLVFESCCNNHDLCYDDCSQQWGPCNDNFRSCNHAACESNFPNEILDALARWGCHQMADFYADVVGSPIGESNFDKANSDRCECGCPTYTQDCGNGVCLGVVNDPSNCGSCGHTCSTGLCDFQTCYELPDASADPCNPNGENFYYFNHLDSSDAISASVTFEITFSNIASKSDCCYACYDPSNGQGCLGYYTTTSGGSGSLTCHILPQIFEGPDSSKKLSQPWPEQCPLGGYDVDFSGQGQGGVSAACQNCRLLAQSAYLICITTNCYKNGSPAIWIDAEPGLCTTGNLG